ncbi:unnamed protein product [Cunninghamella blakesleeana]
MIPLLYHLQSILILILTSHYILGVYCQEVVSGRANPGCVLINDHIYCYGGWDKPTGRDLNENLELDLTEFGDFSIFNKSKIKWKSNSKSINGYELPSVDSTVATNLSDGTILFYGGASDKPNSMPFIHFNPKTNTWNNIPMPNNTYFDGSQIVNIGNDNKCIYGGLLPENTSFQKTLFIYDYKKNLWPIIEPIQGNVSAYYCATLVNDLIYIIDGHHLFNTIYATLNQFITYNTTNGKWGNLTALDYEPDGRIDHSTALTNDKKYILIYGGLRFTESDSSLLPCVDFYYVYTISSNRLEYVPLYGDSQLSTITRFGHFATVYKSKYLLLVFGRTDENTSSDSLNILNIQDPFAPK